MRQLELPAGAPPREWGRIHGETFRGEIKALAAIRSYLTVTGCLGMAGMNRQRVAVAINNMYSIDATLGVVWPAVVRRALHQHSATAARDLIATSPIGSGHHYFIADRQAAFAIESSGTRRKQVFAGGPAYGHTNHCLDRDVAACSKVSPTSTTHDRMSWLEASLAGAAIADLDDAWRRLGSDEGGRAACAATWRRRRRRTGSRPVARSR